jgi:hypothetical protein
MAALNEDVQIWLAIGISACVLCQCVFSMFFMLFALAEARDRYPGIRRDGCLWVLSILATALLSLLWPIMIPLGLFVYLGLAPGQTCCGMACNTWFRRGRLGVDEEQGVLLGNGAADQQPASQRAMELPSYAQATT